MKLLTLEALAVAAFLGGSAAGAADIPYSFEVLDVHQIPVQTLISMNERNERTAWTLPQGQNSKGIYTNAKGQDTLFDCGGATPGDTQPGKINGHGVIGGWCTIGLTTVGFLRDPKKDALTFVTVSGADQTLILGLNSRNHAVGQYYNPLELNRSGLYRIHGFLWDGAKTITIDVPVTNSVTTLLGIDDGGRILGQYFTFDPATNETSASVSFLYDNGQFSAIKVPGSTFSDAWDINRLGQIIGNSDLGVFFYDDGNFYTVQSPQGFRIVSVDNIDDDGRIVGRYTDITNCNIPFVGCPPPQTFLATQMVRGKSGKLIVDLRSKGERE
jgi:uncharacterized membrane protein